MIKRLFLSILILTLSWAVIQAQPEKPFVIPALHTWKAMQGEYNISKTEQIIYNDDKLQPAVQLLGSILRAHTNNEPVTSLQKNTKTENVITLQLTKQKNLGKEGYELTITATGIVAKAQTMQGMLWACQTINQLIDNEGSIECGKTTDVPEYPLRGFMIDCGRKYIPMSYLYETVRCMSALKMNTLQVHLNDNGFKKYFHKNWDETYAAFRLESEYFPELTARDGFYTKAEFRKFVLWAETQGVEIIPEIDAPAHALAFVHFRPEYGNEEFGVDHLDLFNPNVVPFLDSLYSEYLGGKEPVFAGPRVHIGTDEYSNRKQETTEKFREFTNHYIRLVKQYGKKPVVWGSLTWSKGETPVDVEDVLMDMWSNDFAQPDSMKQLGYQMASIPDGWVYIVPAAGYYYDYLNIQLLYDRWTPANINAKIFPEHDPQIEGGMFAVWNDVCGNGISTFDIFHRVRPAMQVIAEKSWSSTVKDKSYEEWVKCTPYIPDYQNTLVGNPVPRGSKATEAICSEVRPNIPLTFSGSDFKDFTLKELGYDKSVSFRITMAKEKKGTVLTLNDDCEFYLSDPITGRIGYARDGYLFSFDYALRPGETHDITLNCTNKETALYIDGKHFQTLGYDERLAADQKPYKIVRTLAFPLKKTGNFKSQVEYIKIK